MKSYHLLFILLFILSCNKTETIQTSIPNVCEDRISATSKNGYTKNYHDNSNDVESVGHYQKGIPQGFWKYFYRNENVRAEGHYEKGKKQGFWKEYYKNGNVKSEGHIKNCKPTGYWKYYDKKGKVTKEMNY